MFYRFDIAFALFLPCLFPILRNAIVIEHVIYTVFSNKEYCYSSDLTTIQPVGLHTTDDLLSF